MPCCDDKNAPSKFNRQVTFEDRTFVATPGGGSEETWVPFAENIWVSITPKLVKELNFAQRIEPRVDHTIRLRYMTGLNPRMRVVYGTRIFEIKAIINEDEGNEYLSILADERTGT